MVNTYSPVFFLGLTHVKRGLVCVQIAACATVALISRFHPYFLTCVLVRKVALIVARMFPKRIHVHKC